MEFVFLTEHKPVKWICTLKVPVDGKHEARTLTAWFHVLGQDRIDAVVAGPILTANDRLLDACLDRLELKDENGAVIPWTDAVREAALRIPYLRDGVIAAFFEMLGRRLPGN